MHTFTQRWFYSGLASAAVLVVAVSIGLDVLDPEQVLRDRSSQRISDRAVSGSQQGNEPVRNKVAEVVAAQAAAPQAGNLEQVAVMRDLPALAGSTSAMGWNASVGAEQKTYVSDSIASLRSPQRDDSLRSVDLQQGRDRFRQFDSNRVKLVSEAPVSTFSIDVDTASYSFVRRQLNQGVLPQKDAVRIEELLNYFEYDYPAPRSRATPFEPSISVVDSPWRAGNKLVHIGIRGYDLPAAQAPDSNLVFLLDVSGSMGQPDKLPLVKQSMAMLLDQLKPTDTVAIVVYAGAAGTVLPTTPAKEKQKIIDALKRLGAGGSTAGGAGIVQAYQ
ncbi:MAG: von Willebrand factor type A domain-containing protein, partial [Pseudomonadales bacterium]